MLYLVGYIVTIPAANWAIAQFEVVPVGFGLVASAGVYLTLLAAALLWAWRRQRVSEFLGADR